MMSSPNDTNDSKNQATVDKTAEQEEVMEVDGQAENENSGDNVQLERYDDDEDEDGDNITLDRVLEYYTRRATNAGDPEIVLYAVNFGGAEHTFYVDAVNVVPDPDAVEPEGGNDESPEEKSFKKMITSAVGEFMNSEEFKPVLQLAHDQLFIDWCTSRQIMTDRGNDV